MRGKAHCYPLPVLYTGITPAYAGKSVTDIAFCAAHGDHPRVCGEKPVSDYHGRYLLGSPPRMRGKARFHGSFSSDLRITPAYAGKSCTPSPTSCKVWDHPRVCGEKSPVIEWFS